MVNAVLTVGIIGALGCVCIYILDKQSLALSDASRAATNEALLLPLHLVFYSSRLIN